jgi:hypothetical protein
VKTTPIMPSLKPQQTGHTTGQKSHSTMLNWKRGKIIDIDSIQKDSDGVRECSSDKDEDEDVEDEGILDLDENDGQ